MMQIQITGTLEQAISAAILSGEFSSPEAFLKAAIRNYRAEQLDTALAKGYQELDDGNVLKVTNIDDFFATLRQETDESPHT